MRNISKKDALQIGGLLGITSTFVLGMYFFLMKPNPENDLFTEQNIEFKTSKSDIQKKTTKKVTTLLEKEIQVEGNPISPKQDPPEGKDRNTNEREEKEAETKQAPIKDKHNSKKDSTEAESPQNKEGIDNLHSLLKDLSRQWRENREDAKKEAVTEITGVDITKHLEEYQKKLDEKLKRLKQILKEIPKKDYERSSIDYSHLDPLDRVVLSNRDVTHDFNEKELEEIANLMSLPKSLNPSKGANFIFPSIYNDDLKRIKTTHETIVAYAGKLLGKAKLMFLAEGLILDAQTIAENIDTDRKFAQRLWSYFVEKRTPEQRIELFKKSLQASLKGKRTLPMDLITSSLHGINLTEKDKQYFLGCYHYALGLFKNDQIVKTEKMTKEEARAFFIEALKNMLFTTQYFADDVFFEEGTARRKTPIIDPKKYQILLEEIMKLDQFETLRVRYRWKEVIEETKITAKTNPQNFPYIQKKLKKGISLFKDDKGQLERIKKKLEKLKTLMFEHNMDINDIQREIRDLEVMISKLN